MRSSGLTEGEDEVHDVHLAQVVYRLVRVAFTLAAFDFALDDGASLVGRGVEEEVADDAGEHRSEGCGGFIRCCLFVRSLFCWKHDRVV